MKAKFLFHVVVLMLVGFILMPKEPSFAESGKTSPQETQKKEPPPPPPPGSVSPARPEIESPSPTMHYLRCPHCGKVIYKPWGKDYMYGPKLSTDSGTTKIIKKGAPDCSKRKVLRRIMPRDEFIHTKTHPQGKGLAAERFLRHARELGLSDEQKSKLEDLVFKTKRELIDLKASLQKARLDLMKLMHEEEPNTKAIKRQLDAVASAQVSFKFSVISSMLGAKKILTEEQREILKERIHKHGEGCCEEFCEGILEEDCERIIHVDMDEDEGALIEVIETEE